MKPRWLLDFLLHFLVIVVITVWVLGTAVLMAIAVGTANGYLLLVAFLVFAVPFALMQTWFRR